MTEEHNSFAAGIDFKSILSIISKQIYETPLAFLRENVQNAVDAVLLQAKLENIEPSNTKYGIDIEVDGRIVSIKDNGIGMSRDDLKSLFWTMGASGKRTPEARAAGCVGTFGIGGFANFGICDKLEVFSKTEADAHGTLTYLTKTDIQEAGSSLPRVTYEDSDEVKERGTIVRGYLWNEPDIEEMRRYLSGFVRFVPIAIFFNKELLSKQAFNKQPAKDNLKEITMNSQYMAYAGVSIKGRFYEDRGHALAAFIDGLEIDGKSLPLSGEIRFESGSIDILKHGFKLCATQVPTTIGISGRLDSDIFVPTAGRDSLNSESMGLLSKIAQVLERAAVFAVLEESGRLSQHTRIFRYILQNNLVDKIGRAIVTLADGSQTTLMDIRRRAVGDVKVYFGSANSRDIYQIMQTRGHIVVMLSSDNNRRTAEMRYLQTFCSAKQLDGVVDIQERYKDLTLFHKLFLSELESNIQKSYNVISVKFIPGKLTEDTPLFLRETGKDKSIEILIDVKHPEIAKLEQLGYTDLFYSLVSNFCQEYLGSALKKWSPRFFGNGALNFELLAKRRSDLWVLVKDDIGVVHRGGQKQVVKNSDIHVINVMSIPKESHEHSQIIPSQQSKTSPRLVKIVGDAGLEGYYLRLVDSAFSAFGDILLECQSRGIVWAGNKIEYVLSDTVNSAFKYEIRLDRVVVVAADNGEERAEGAIPIEHPFQQIFGGLYFPIPKTLQKFLVPESDKEIRLELFSSWFDANSLKSWTLREKNSQTGVVSRR